MQVGCIISLQGTFHEWYPADKIRAWLVFLSTNAYHLSEYHDKLVSGPKGDTYIDHEFRFLLCGVYFGYCVLTLGHVISAILFYVCRTLTIYRYKMSSGGQITGNTTFDKESGGNVTTYVADGPTGRNATNNYYFNDGQKWSACCIILMSIDVSIMGFFSMDINYK